MTARLLSAALAVVTLTALSLAQTNESAIAVPANPRSSMVHGAGQTPNILFIIMDDVGIDQMQVFGYGGGTASATPNIDTIAHAGLRFRNVWAMPECSPSRAIYFEGRFPLRTNIYNAILSIDLANSQLSPYEVTTPNVLRTVGYSSALFGKFHLGGGSAETNPYNPYGQGTPHAAGFDYFDGFLEGAPYPIDTTAGWAYFVSFQEAAKDFSQLSQTKLAMPVLTIGGDKSLGEALGQQVRLVATDVTVVVLKDTGHWVLEERPKETTEALQKFL